MRKYGVLANARRGLVTERSRQGVPMEEIKQVSKILKLEGILIKYTFSKSPCELRTERELPGNTDTPWQFNPSQPAVPREYSRRLVNSLLGCPFGY